MLRRAWLSIAFLSVAALAHAQTEAPDNAEPAIGGPFSFAVLGTADDHATTALVRAGGDSAARFVVHFDIGEPSRESCSDAATERRHSLLDASVKPIVAVIAGSEWSSCGAASVDPMERLERSGDLLFGTDESLGQRRMPWLRQSAMPRFKRYRENVRWTSGRVVFATLNLPADDNGFRRGAGRNGEFEDRLVADRAWLDRTFRFAAERRMAGVVIFFDAAPRFDLPLRAPDARATERDGYYEIKVVLRDHAATFKGQILLVQGRRARGAAHAAEPDRPLKDTTGKVIANVRRIAVTDNGADARWLRVDVDAASPSVFRVAVERLFDDPSGELYGTSRLK